MLHITTVVAGQCSFLLEGMGIDEVRE